MNRCLIVGWILFLAGCGGNATDCELVASIVEKGGGDAPPHEQRIADYIGANIQGKAWAYVKAYQACRSL